MSIARSIRSVGQASSGLVGRHGQMSDASATRDMTRILARSGFAIKVHQKELATKLNALNCTFAKGITGCCFATLAIVYYASFAICEFSTFRYTPGQMAA